MLPSAHMLACTPQIGSGGYVGVRDVKQVAAAPSAPPPAVRTGVAVREQQFDCIQTPIPEAEYPPYLEFHQS